MAKRTVVALEKQLIRELRHRAWLAQHLPNTTELSLKLGRAVER